MDHNIASWVRQAVAVDRFDEIGFIRYTWANILDECSHDPSDDLLPLVKCVFGNPFRPVDLDPNWLTAAVVALATGIYADRAWDRLPVLADALEDAGCTDPDVIGHLRGPGPHARGCWPVDLVLGKS